MTGERHVRAGGFMLKWKPTTHEMPPRCVNSRGRDTTDRRSVVQKHSTPTSSPTQSIHPANDTVLFGDTPLPEPFLRLLIEADEQLDALFELGEDLIQDLIVKASVVPGWDGVVAARLMTWVFWRHRIVTAGMAERAFPKMDPHKISVVRERSISDAEDAIYRREVDELKSMPYRDYLQTDHWGQMRYYALEESGHRCQLCNSDTSLQVHHRTYERRGEEKRGDLIVLCASCHQHFHDKLKVVR